MPQGMMPPMGSDTNFPIDYRIGPTALTVCPIPRTRALGLTNPGFHLHLPSSRSLRHRIPALATNTNLRSA